MNIVLVFLLPIAAWCVTLYLILRFLRAFERGVYAHERIANAIVRQFAALSSRPGDRTP